MNPNNHIPFIDLISPHREIEDQLVEVFRQSLRSAAFIGGPMVEELEREFAAFCGAKYCIGVGSGTDALRFALTASGVKQGDMVITVPNTFIATTEAITQAGAAIAFVDIDEKTYNMSPAKLQKYLETQCCTDRETGNTLHSATGKTVRAVVPVHLYGQTADMDRIAEIAERYHLIVIEDACQAHGAEYLSRRHSRWMKAGSMGTAAAFSFYPGKNLGACGEAGAVTTNDENIAKTIRMIRDHGQAKKYFHDREGYNGRLDAIQAGILTVKLRRLKHANDQRVQHARRYNGLLAAVDGVVVPYEPSWSQAVYHLYVIRVQDRDALQSFLSERGISTGLHYPVPLHQQKAYADLPAHHGSLLASERMAREILSLPMYPGLTEQQQVQVAEAIKEFLSRTQSMEASEEMDSCQKAVGRC